VCRVDRGGGDLPPDARLGSSTRSSYPCRHLPLCRRIERKFDYPEGMGDWQHAAEDEVLAGLAAAQ
jgi:hypothetical protein